MNEFFFGSSKELVGRRKLLFHEWMGELGEHFFSFFRSSLFLQGAISFKELYFTTTSGLLGEGFNERLAEDEVRGARVAAAREFVELEQEVH